MKKFSLTINEDPRSFAGQSQQSIQRKVLISTGLGVFLEWYDYMAFAAVATIIAQSFFPSGNPQLALLASLGTFGAGMLVRPLGSIIIGSLGDRYGRRLPFIATVALMGISTIGIGLLPTYEKIGIWAPLLLLLLRLAQGFSVGGETGASSVYTVEHAPAHRRALYSSVLFIMTIIGMLILTAEVMLLRHYLSAADFLEWGWRVPFWISILILAISIKLRLDLQESPYYEQLRNHDAVSHAPLRECLATPLVRRHMLLLFFSIGTGSILFYISQVYTSIFLLQTVGMEQVTVQILFMSSTVLMIPLCILFGWVSDIIGRRPIFLAGLLLGAITIYPVFFGYQVVGTYDGPLRNTFLYGLMLIPILAYTLIIGPFNAIVCELFPTRMRSTAVAIPYNFSAGWIGGMSPFVISLINDTTGSTTAGLLFPATILFMSFIVGWLYLPETRDTGLDW